MGTLLPNTMLGNRICHEVGSPQLVMNRNQARGRSVNYEESISPFANRPVGRVRQRALPRRQPLTDEALGKNFRRSHLCRDLHPIAGRRCQSVLRACWRCFVAPELRSFLPLACWAWMTGDFNSSPPAAPFWLSLVQHRPVDVRLGQRRGGLDPMVTWTCRSRGDCAGSRCRVPESCHKRSTARPTSPRSLASLEKSGRS